MNPIHFVVVLFALFVLAPWQSAKAADVICYNCPPEWADWASMLKAIKADLGYDIPHDNKNSGQALAHFDQLTVASRHRRPSITSDWRTA